MIVADTESKKLSLKEKEIELEDLEQLSEIQRNLVVEQKKQFQLLQTSEVISYI